VAPIVANRPMNEMGPVPGEKSAESAPSSTFPPTVLRQVDRLGVALDGFARGGQNESQLPKFHRRQPQFDACPPVPKFAATGRGTPSIRGKMVTKKVLLCDDEVHILWAAEIKIARAGYDVRIAHDGQEAWELILQDPPDLLVTDVQMPRCDGFELARRIRDNPHTKYLPIVMLTAKGFEFDRQQIMQQWGIAEVLAKPFSPRELAHVIDGLLCDMPAPVS
jgi:CheY-like chemotaxis protein